MRTTGPAGGVHYLQYSFAPRLYIFNAFLQSLIGLHDFGKLAGETRATELFRQAEPEAREEMPLSDVGDWSRYSYLGAESTREYHELLREFLQSMCIRRLGKVYCDLAARYRGYTVDPPELAYTGPAQATEDDLTSLSFTVSKLSVVEMQRVPRREGRVLAACHLPPRRRRVRVAAARTGAVHGAGGREGAAHRAGQEGQRLGRDRGRERARAVASRAWPQALGSAECARICSGDG